MIVVKFSGRGGGAHTTEVVLGDHRTDQVYLQACTTKNVVIYELILFTTNVFGGI